MFVADVRPTHQHQPQRKVFASEAAAEAWARNFTKRRGGVVVVWELGEGA